MICSGEHNDFSDQARAPLDARTLARLQPALEEVLRAIITASSCAPFPSPFNERRLDAALMHVRAAPCSPDERRRYLLFVAPISRRLVLAHPVRRGPETPEAMTAVRIQHWLQRLESFDPLSALMIDVRYFAGLSLRRTAAVVGVSDHTVIQDLRFAKAWLAAYLNEPSSMSLRAVAAKNPGAK